MLDPCRGAGVCSSEPPVLLFYNLHTVRASVSMDQQGALQDSHRVGLSQPTVSLGSSGEPSSSLVGSSTHLKETCLLQPTVFTPHFWCRQMLTCD